MTGFSAYIIELPVWLAVKETDAELPAGKKLVVSMPAPNIGELLTAFVGTISHACGLVPTLYTVIEYVIPSWR